MKDDDLGKIIFFFRICRKKPFAEHSTNGNEWGVDRRGNTGSGWTSVTFSSSSAQFLNISMMELCHHQTLPYFYNLAPTKASFKLIWCFGYPTINPGSPVKTGQEELYP